MNRDILESIVRKAAESSGIQLDNDEISQMVDRTEQRLNKKLTGYGKIDRPYEQFYSPDALVDNFEDFKLSADGMYDSSVCEGNNNCPREGFVYYKTTDPNFSFKNVSREYLLKH